MTNIIGLTGNSGSGKGMVADIMRDNGALILDCDKIVHDNMAIGGASYKDIINYFGNDILNDDNTINRAYLGNIVFNDKVKLNKLNEISHRYVTSYIKQMIKEHSKSYKYIVIDAPLLFEAGLEVLCSSVWLVYADENIRLDRVINRDNITKEKAIARFNNQCDYKELIKKADVIIDNNGGLKELKRQVIANMAI